VKSLGHGPCPLDLSVSRDQRDIWPISTIATQGARRTESICDFFLSGTMSCTASDIWEFFFPGPAARACVLPCPRGTFPVRPAIPSCRPRHDSLDRHNRPAGPAFPPLVRFPGPSPRPPWRSAPPLRRPFRCARGPRPGPPAPARLPLPRPTLPPLLLRPSARARPLPPRAHPRAPAAPPLAPLPRLHRAHPPRPRPPPAPPATRPLPPAPLPPRPRVPRLLLSPPPGPPSPPRPCWASPFAHAPKSARLLAGPFFNRPRPRRPDSTALLIPHHQSLCPLVSPAQPCFRPRPWNIRGQIANWPLPY